MSHHVATAVRIVLMLWFFTAHAATPATRPPTSSPTIFGDWKYTGFFYREMRYPPSDPDLEVVFTFNADNTERLYWTRTSNMTFCERKGVYTADGGVLKQKVTWVNPDNEPSCSRDPDMQVGTTAENAVDIGEKQLSIHMFINDEPLLYLLERR